ncbi:MAG: putative lipid II flippase FtsW [Candidatus Margulisbacteria bacterium]|nr:putative lipid II flippase FtsW [Candidatus Margulisiibacteriota bacterium]
MSLENWYQDYPPKSKPDKLLFFAALFLVLFGLMMIISSSTILGFKVYNDSFYFVKKHLLFIGMGIVPFLLGYMIPHQVWRKWSFYLWIGSLFLVLLTYIPHIGSTAGGSSRWINIAGFRFQPSDVLKLTLFLYVSHLLDLRKDYLKDFKQVVLPVFTIIGISALLVLKQPDLGTSIVLGSVSLILLFISGFPMVYLVTIFSGALLAAIFSILHNPYQLKRVTAFLNPWDDPLGKGFHIIQSLIAVGNGGLFGLGIGQSRQKFFYLPQQYTDFIFSIIAEEFGFIATSIFILFFLFFIYRSFLIAARNQDLFSKLLCVGLALWIAIQAIINISVTINLMPTKGITLPFISFGGTSLIMIMWITGIILNISRYRNITQ